MGRAGEVERCDLQIAPVDVALVKRDTAVGGYLLRCAAAHVVVLAMHGGDGAVNRLAGKIRRAVLGIVADGPDAGARLHAGLVAGGIVGRDEVGNIIHREHRILVERIGLVAGDFLSILLCGLAVADVVVVVGVAAVVHRGGSQFAAVVVAEGVVDGLPVAGGAAGERAAECIVGVAALGHGGAAALVEHAGEQVTLRLVALGERHVAGQREHVVGISCLQRSVFERMIHQDTTTPYRNHGQITYLGCVSGSLSNALTIQNEYEDTQRTHTCKCYRLE